MGICTPRRFLAYARHPALTNQRPDRRDKGAFMADDLHLSDDLPSDLAGDDIHPLFHGAPTSTEFRKLRKRLVREVRAAIETYHMVTPGDRWLVVVKDRVVDRADLPLAAVRRAEAALGRS